MNRKRILSLPVRKEMKLDKNFDNFVGDDSFAFAEVACYLLAMLSILDVLILLAGVSPYSLDDRFSSGQRSFILAIALIFQISSAACYYAIARRLSTCTMLLWRVTLGVFLLNLIWSAQLMTVKPGPLPMLLGILSVGGVISVVRGHKAMRKSSAVGAKRHV
ncbi:hypothetical protein [Pandoraea sp. NPDC090278]|uniref:hypothetical protein n=1 Tax=Pandoraea sp. NPDC090278 TaxID=3364391 RepID=UPI00383A253D